MPRILLMEDEVSFRKVLRLALERVGHEVLEAGDGVEGLKLLRDHAVDLVLTDLVMPEKEGIETIIEIRRVYPALKIVAMSGDPKFTIAQSNLRVAHRLGATKVLQKPFASDQLFAAIDETLGPPRQDPPQA